MKTVLITGGNRGLGKAFVECFAADGWRVLATARHTESLPSAVSAGFALDLANHDQMVQVSKALSKESIDCIIHNAGFNPKDVKDRPNYFESTYYCKDFSAANVSESLFINALHPMELTGRLMPVLKDDCIVVAVTSWLGSIGGKTPTEFNSPGHYGYGGSKALMNMFMKALSLEFDRDPEHRVAVALNPGWMKTDMGGGDRADISPEDVASRLLAMIKDGFVRTQNGKFLNSDRTEHGW